MNELILILDAGPRLENPGLVHHFGANMASFGKNPNGKNLYRIVNARTRRTLVDPRVMEGPTKWVRKYPMEGKRANWILEKWRSVADYCGGKNAAVYARETGICLTDEGEYDLCFEFENGVPAAEGIGKIISWIDMSDKRRPIENAIAVRSEWEQQEKDRDASIEGRIREALPAFGLAPVSGFGGGSGTKTETRFKRSASQTPFKMPQVRKAKGWEKEAVVFQGTFGQKQQGGLIQHA